MYINICNCYVSLSKLGLGLKMISPTYDGACNMEYKCTNEDTTQPLIAWSDACHFPVAPAAAYIQRGQEVRGALWSAQRQDQCSNLLYLHRSIEFHTDRARACSESWRKRGGRVDAKDRMREKGKMRERERKANDGALGIQAEKGSWEGADSPWSDWISLYCWSWWTLSAAGVVSLCMSFQIIFHMS